MAKQFFNEIEGLKIAENMEKHGLAFYEAAAANAKTEETRQVFRQLAEDEKDHYARFAELEEEFQQRRQETTTYNDGAEIAEYIDRLVSTQVFSSEGDVARLADQIGSDYEALGVGMRAERDSIAFYQEMIDLVDSKHAQEAFGKILEQERKHLRILGERSEHCEDYSD